MRRKKQHDATDCGLACVAMLAKVSVDDVKRKARDLFNWADENDFSTEGPELRKLLNFYKIQTAKRLVPFNGWDKLPSLCILAINYHEMDETWHWVIFERKDGEKSVTDPNSYVKANKRTDFGRMKPKWYLKIYN